MPNFTSPASVTPMVSNPNPYPDGASIDPTPVTMTFAGTTQATAAPITDLVATITNNTAANGGILPVGSAGQRILLIPSLVTNAPLVYPPVGGTINFGTVNAGVAITARKVAEFVALDATGLNWGLNQGA